MIESIVLTNLSTQQSILMDQEESEFVLDVVDFGTVPGTHNSYKYVNQIGAYIDSTTLGTRSISISGWVVGKDEQTLQYNKMQLNRLVNPIHPIRIRCNDQYQITFSPDYSVQYSTVRSENNHVLSKYLIQGTCADPLFTQTHQTSVQVSSTLPRFRFPLVIPQNQGILMGLREPALLTTLVNSGDVPIGLVIVFTFTGTVKNPRLLDVDTQEFIQLNHTFTPDEQVVISTASGEKYIQGRTNEEITNYFSYLDFDSTWLQLRPGDNTLKYDADENPENLNVSLQFCPKYLEVQ